MLTPWLSTVLFAALAAAEPEPVLDPAGTPGDALLFPDDAALARLADADMAAARPLLRRVARSSPSAASRAAALRLLGGSDASGATARICVRALRIDDDALVRRSGAECLGRVGAALCEPHTPALVGALDDESLDVVTMAGWALANGGAVSGYADVVARTEHPDPRVAKLFLGYGERMRARLGLDFAAEQKAPPEELRDAAGNRLIPPGVALTSAAHGVTGAAAAGWLGIYGASVGWLHGTLLPSAQGGPDGATVAPLVGLGTAALGAAGLAAYGVVRADTVTAAHTVVQLGAAGTVAGFGTGLLVGPAPQNAIAAANLSLLGTLGGTALGIALVETDATPTLGALGLGAFTGLTTAVAVGGLARAYLPSLSATAGMAMLTGSLAMSGATLAAWDQDIGLLPLAGGTVGMLAGTGLLSGTALLLEPTRYTETSGWLVLSGTVAGAAGGTLLGMLLPKAWDPLLSPDVRPDVQIRPPTWAFLDDGKGGAVPALVLAGAF